MTQQLATIAAGIGFLICIATALVLTLRSGARGDKASTLRSTAPS